MAIAIETHSVVEENTKNGGEHAAHIEWGDRVSKGCQRDNYHKNAFGRVGYRVGEGGQLTWDHIHLRSTQKNLMDQQESA